MEYTTLSIGVKMPMLGYGVYQVSPQECERCVLDALGAGYRLLDTAQSYFNEAQVGSAIRKSGVPREDIFLTTKVWVEDYGQQAARASVLDSMEKLGVDYLDLVLLHQPFADYYGAWRALEEIYDEGLVRAIGVSNFYPDRLVDLASFARIRPMVDQVEMHPFHQQAEAIQWMKKYGAQPEAWAPFGEGRGGLFSDPVLTPPRQDRRPGHAALALAAGGGGHPKVRPCGAHAGKSERVRFFSQRRGDGVHRRAGQKAERIFLPSGPEYGRMVRRDGGAAPAPAGRLQGRMTPGIRRRYHAQKFRSETLDLSPAGVHSGQLGRGRHPRRDERCLGRRER